MSVFVLYFPNMGKSEIDFKILWDSWFDVGILSNTHVDSVEFFGPMVMLHTAMSLYNKIAVTFGESQKHLQSLKLELAAKNTKLSDLKEQLQDLKQPCISCSNLSKELTAANRRVKSAEKRVNEIAKIVSLKSLESEIQPAISQLAAASPKQKKNYGKENNSQLNQCDSPLGLDGTESKDSSYLIPATEFKVTPRKNLSESIISNRILRNSPRDNASSPLIISSDIIRNVCTPKRNLSADFDRNKGTPTKISFDIGTLPPNLELRNKLDSPGLGVNLDADEDSNFDLIERKQISPKKSKSPKNDKVICNKEVWKMKRKRSVGVGSKMKQLTLSVEIPEKVVDISTIKCCNTPVNSEDEDDIVLPSPSKGQSRLFSDSMDLSFAPKVSSTQISAKTENDDFKFSYDTKKKKRKALESSYDRIPSPLGKKSPDYAYKHKTVRGKERAKLPGWDCGDCREYYNLYSGGSSKAVSHMNTCSKHRMKHPVNRIATPPGYWNVDMPSTEEAKKMYESVHEAFGKVTK